MNPAGPSNQPRPGVAHPVGHVLAPAAAVTLLSLALVGGLGLLGVLGRLDAVIATLVSREGTESFPNRLPPWLPWAAAAVLAPSLASAILATPGLWRRTVLWVTAVVLIVAWAPVLSLAAYEPRIAAPCVACFWSGICALVYSANHRMPCDFPNPPTS